MDIQENKILSDIKKIKISLDLSSFCIFTAVKREYERLLRSALKKEPEDEFLYRLEFLKRILEEVDLKSLRGFYPELQGGNQSSVLLVIEDNKAGLEFSGKKISLDFRK